MKKLTLFTIVAILLLLVTGLIILAHYTVFSSKETSDVFSPIEKDVFSPDNDLKQKPFYVGVTYCGGSVKEAKALVDRVKDCTNLFVLQSWTLQRDISAMEEIGDYVVDLGLSFAVYSNDKIDYYDDKGYYYGVNVGREANEWVNTAKERWQEHFIGIYYRDEPGGCVLDGKLVTLDKTIEQTDEMAVSTAQLTKFKEAITVYNDENTRDDTTFSSRTTFDVNGDVSIVNTFYRPDNNAGSSAGPSSSINRVLRVYYLEYINYYHNGTITIRESTTVWHRGNFYTTANLTKYPWPITPYETLLQQNPMQTYDDAAKVFVNMNEGFLKDINKKQLNSEAITVFTADYGLYWWDYKSGYDLILAELAWNNSVTQEIGLVRGAANLQNKQWGTILTWKYTQAPYLADGEEMFEQMKTSYEAGAQYVLIFNYSEDQKNPNILQEEHFQALERFWTEVVQNPKIKHGNIKAEAVLVLPQNYGWGIRNPKDNIWGIWPADENAQEIWSQIQNSINQYGLKLDIIFEDPIFPVTDKYPNIYYWNPK